jgi:hypothetical protein
MVALARIAARDLHRPRRPRSALPVALTVPGRRSVRAARFVCWVRRLRLSVRRERAALPVRLSAAVPMPVA